MRTSKFSLGSESEWGILIQIHRQVDNDIVIEDRSTMSTEQITANMDLIMS